MVEPQLAPAAQDVGKGAVPDTNQALDLGDGAAILRKALPQRLQQPLLRLGARFPPGSFLLHGPAFWMAGADRKRCLGPRPEPWSPGGPAAGRLSFLNFSCPRAREACREESSGENASP